MGKYGQTTIEVATASKLEIARSGASSIVFPASGRAWFMHTHQESRPHLNVGSEMCLYTSHMSNDPYQYRQEVCIVSAANDVTGLD